MEKLFIFRSHYALGRFRREGVGRADIHGQTQMLENHILDRVTYVLSQYIEVCSWLRGAENCSKTY